MQQGLLSDHFVPETSTGIEAKCCRSHDPDSYPFVPNPLSSWFPKTPLLPWALLLPLLQFPFSPYTSGTAKDQEKLGQVLKQY